MRWASTNSEGSRATCRIDKGFRGVKYSFVVGFMPLGPTSKMGDSRLLHSLLLA